MLVHPHRLRDLIADGEAPKILIAPDKKADTLSVIDSGIGIPQNMLPICL